MGPIVSRDIVLRTKECSHKHITYCPSANSVMVVYGRLSDPVSRVRTPEDCIITDSARGARTELIGLRHTMCILKHNASIHNSGVVRMEAVEALLCMESGSCIDVGTNARLIIDGVLLMGKRSRLVIEPGACIIIVGYIYLADDVVVSVASERTFVTGNHKISISGRMDDSFSYSCVRCIPQSGEGLVTWCSDDQLFLIGLIRFFSYNRKWELPPDLILPYVLPHVCRRYGVLMAPSNESFVPKNSRHAVKCQNMTHVDSVK